MNKIKGHCYEMFAKIVQAKFQAEFDRAGISGPSIGNKEFRDRGRRLLWSDIILFTFFVTFLQVQMYKSNNEFG